jgi:triosephosphate isomerase
MNKTSPSNTARRPLIAGNWKMNGTRDSAVALAGQLRAGVEADDSLACDLLVCPPSIYLLAVAETLGKSMVLLGAQDCSAESPGAHTGDISAGMLADAACAYVILGHSERRKDHGESDALVREKAQAAQAAGLVAIVCVGETGEERDRGATLDVVSRQLRGSLPADAPVDPAPIVVAYEPVWAIGSGLTPTLDEISTVHGHLRHELRSLRQDADSIRILYGGSVKPDNAREILALSDIDGALVGGASLNAEGFLMIAHACMK